MTMGRRGRGASLPKKRWWTRRNMVVALLTVFFVGRLVSLGTRRTPSEAKPRRMHLDKLTFGMETGPGRPWMELVSWKPRAALLHNFLTDRECDYLRDVSISKLKRSVVGNINLQENETEVDGARDSSGVFFSPRMGMEDKVSARLRRRAALFTGIAEEQQELVQVLRYEEDQKYLPHFDAGISNETGKFVEGYGRLATMLVYLQMPDQGGDTNFPEGERLAGRAPEPLGDAATCQGKVGLSVKPRKGDALFFYSLDPTASYLDEASLHESCAVVGSSVDKWTVSIWMHRVGNPQYTNDFGTMSLW
mmetsp:Transcript_902/g.2661  ORF Transcript_902/g.2661 Transcript_902/m.2661 type:complete len:306 (+) Transcript_902:27-944(+)